MLLELPVPPLGRSSLVRLLSPVQVAPFQEAVVVFDVALALVAAQAGPSVSRLRHAALPRRVSLEQGPGLFLLCQ